MPSRPTITHLKRFRELRRLTAAELAKAAGISRQTIYAMEDGSYVPNTSVALQLAQVLGTTVEELFRLERQLPTERVSDRATLLEDWSARQGRLLRLSRVGNNLVAAPQAARSAYLPAADGWICDQSIGRAAGQKINVEIAAGSMVKALVIAGCDPALSLLERLLIPSGVDVFSVSCSSRQALRWLQQGLVHVAGSHLVDRKSGEYNLGVLRQIFPNEQMNAVGFARWEQGLLVANGNPKQIKNVNDLARAEVSIVNRQSGSGSRQLLDAEMHSSGIESQNVAGYERIAGGHLAAARHVAAGRADCCIASRAVASVYGLPFMPLQEEHFELCFHSATMSIPAMRVLLDVLNAAELRAQLRNFAGYDTSQTGVVRRT